MSVPQVNGALADHDVRTTLAVLSDQALALAGRADRPPSRIRVTAAGVSVEIDWSTGSTAAGLAGAEPATAVGQSAVPSVRVAHDPEPPPASATFTLHAGMVGMFYRASEPGAEPFVREGDVVRVGQQVALLEVMKMMLPVDAERAGRVERVLVADGTSVEHGQPLIEFTPVEAAP